MNKCICPFSSCVMMKNGWSCTLDGGPDGICEEHLEKAEDEK